MQKSRDRRYNSDDRPKNFYFTAGLLVIFIIFLYKFWNTSTLANELLEKNGYFKLELSQLNSKIKNLLLTIDNKTEEIKSFQTKSEIKEDQCNKKLADSKIELEACNTEKKNDISDIQLSSCDKIQVLLDQCNVKLDASLSKLVYLFNQSKNNVEKNKPTNTEDNKINKKANENENIKEDKENINVSNADNNFINQKILKKFTDNKNMIENTQIDNVNMNNKISKKVQEDEIDDTESVNKVEILNNQSKEENKNMVLHGQISEQIIKNKQTLLNDNKSENHNDIDNYNDNLKSDKTIKFKKSNKTVTINADENTNLAVPKLIGSYKAKINHKNFISTEKFKRKHNRKTKIKHTHNVRAGDTVGNVFNSELKIVTDDSKVSNNKNNLQFTRKIRDKEIIKSKENDLKITNKIETPDIQNDVTKVFDQMVNKVEVVAIVSLKSNIVEDVNSKYIDESHIERN